MKIVITARNFSTQNKEALNMLTRAGFEIVDYSDMNYGNGTSEEKMAELIGDADIVITGLEPFTSYIIEHCPNIKLLSKRSIGYDSVDLDACKKAGITVTRTTGMVEAAVAEHVMAYILYFARDIARQNSDMHEKIWNRFQSFGAKNRTLGLIGFGGIGKEIAKRAVPFGMNVLYYCRHPHEEWEREYHVKYCSLDELLASSDYVSINVNLSDSTKNMISEKEFSLMKKESIFINIARSQVVDTLALKNALDQNKIKGACIDVFDSEPCINSPLIDCPNAILTPHTAPFTSENFIAMNKCAAQNVLDFMTNSIKPENKLV